MSVYGPGIYAYDHRQANKGKALEDFLLWVHDRYQAQGTACMHKVPTEFIPIRGHNGKVVDVKVERKSCVDYLGRYGAVPVAVEAKMESGARIAFSRVEDHQAAYLDDWETDGIGLVLVSFRMARYFAVPWPFWRAGINSWTEKKSGAGNGLRVVEAYGMRWTTPGMASVSPEQMHPAWEIKTGGTVGLPYLKIIDRMVGGDQDNGNR